MDIQKQIIFLDLSRRCITQRRMRSVFSPLFFILGGIGQGKLPSQLLHFRILWCRLALVAYMTVKSN